MKKHGFILFEFILLGLILMSVSMIIITIIYMPLIKCNLYNEKFHTEYTYLDFLFAEDTITKFFNGGVQNTSNINLNSPLPVEIINPGRSGRGNKMTIEEFFIKNP